MATAIEIRHLTKHYGDHTALDGLTLDVREGEVFGFLGHNGAGKTTTVNILTTLLKPSSGSARICGYDVVRDSMQVRRRIGYLPENVRLYDGLSATDNLKFFARLSGVSDPAARIRETLAFVGATHLGRRAVGTLSKGQRQRIGLAQAMLHQPQVLFLDEPASGLDPVGIKTLRDLIIELNREFGTTIFMNTHLIGEVAKTCTSIAVLNQGRLVMNDTSESTLRRFDDEEALEELYLSLTPMEAA